MNEIIINYNNQKKDVIVLENGKIAEIRKRTNKLFEIMNDTKDENGSNRSLIVRQDDVNTGIHVLKSS